MPRKTTKKRGKSVLPSAFEFTGEEAFQADKEARARPTLKRQKLSILSTLPDTTQRLVALSKKPFLCTRTDEADEARRTTLEDKRESKPGFGRRLAPYHASESQKKNTRFGRRGAIKSKAVPSVNRRASIDSVVPTPKKREVTPDPPSAPSCTQESSEASSALRRSGRKRFRTTKAYLAYEDSRKHKRSKKRMRSKEQEGDCNNRTLPERKSSQKSPGSERIAEGQELCTSERLNVVEPVPMDGINDKLKTVVEEENPSNEAPHTKAIDHAGTTDSGSLAKDTSLRTRNKCVSVSVETIDPGTLVPHKVEHSANTRTDTQHQPSSVHKTGQDSGHVSHEKKSVALDQAAVTDNDQPQGSTTSSVPTRSAAVIKQVVLTVLGHVSDPRQSGGCIGPRQQNGKSQVEVVDQKSENGKHIKESGSGNNERDTKLELLRSKTDTPAAHQTISQENVDSPVTPVNQTKSSVEGAKSDIETLNKCTMDAGRRDDKPVLLMTDVNRNLTLHPGQKDFLVLRKESEEGETRNSRNELPQRKGFTSPKTAEQEGTAEVSTLDESKTIRSRENVQSPKPTGEKKIEGTARDSGVSVDQQQDASPKEPTTPENALPENVKHPSTEIMGSKNAARPEKRSENSGSTFPLTYQLRKDRLRPEAVSRRTTGNTVVPEIVTEVLNNCTSATRKEAKSRNLEGVLPVHMEDPRVEARPNSHERINPCSHSLKHNGERQDSSQEEANPTAREATDLESTGPSGLNSGRQQHMNCSADVSIKKASIETKKANQRPHAALQRTEEARQTFSKRVRFLEPKGSALPGESRRDLSGILKMRMRNARRRQVSLTDRTDVSVMTGHAIEHSEKEERVLLDELQYLLDGIFKPSGNSGKKSPQLESQLIAKTLVSLISLLKRRPHAKMSAEGGEHESAMIQILVKQPSLFNTIVGKLCSVFGKSRSVDAVLAVVFVLIFRETPKLRLIEAPELDILLNAFFRSSAAALKDDEVGNTSKSQSKEAAAPDVKRRRGRLAKRFEETTSSDSFLSTLNKVVSEANILEDGFGGFKGETVCAAHLIGIAISLILCFDNKLRLWMRENRRLDRVVAVLYSCEKVMLQKTSPSSEQKALQFTHKEVSTPWIVLGASLRVLEFTVLDEVCQSRTARESRLCAIVVDVIQSVHHLKEGPFSGEWILSAALRVGINLCHGFKEASRQFVTKGGHELVLKWIVKECNAAGLLTSGIEGLEDNDCEQCFDVRVLCLALLATIVDQEEDICDMFRTMSVPGLTKRKAGGIEIVLEILQAAEAFVEKADGMYMKNESLAEPTTRRHIQTDEHSEESELVMERKITIGYASLLIGALVRDNAKNRKIVEDILPSHNLVGVAAVLTSFLEFHHEVGIISGSMDRMYARIISSLVKPFQAAESGILAENVPKLGIAHEGSTNTDEKQSLDAEDKMIS